MEERRNTSRRDVLGLAPLAMAGVAAATVLPRAAAAADAPRPAGPRPTQEEIDRIARLYGGEFGGGRSAR